MTQPQDQGNQSGAEGQQQQPAPQGQEQQNQQGLLDAEAQQGEQPPEGGESLDGDVMAQLTQQIQTLQATFQSEIDRRVNQVVSTLRREMGGQQQGQQPQDHGSGAPPVQGASVADVREARLEYRSAVEDEIRFLGAAERELASQIAAGLIRSELETGGDPDAVGRKVAKQVAAQIKSTRKLYEDKTVAALQRRGQLKESPTAQGQPLPSRQQTPGPGASYARAQQTAREMFPERFSQQQQS